METVDAVVLGGGGLAGIGWMVGVLAALEDSGMLDPGGAGRVIGTSAGASVGAAVLRRGSAAALFDDMVRVSRRNEELAPAARLSDVLPDVLAVHADTIPVAEKAARFVALSRARSGVDPELRRAAIAGRIGGDDWPSASLQVTAVRGDGTMIVLDRHSGVGLVDAVTASCAVPGL